MRTRYLAPAAVFLVALLLPSPASTAAPPGPTIHSAVVTVAGPSVYEEFARLAGSEVPVDQVRVRADTLLRTVGS